MTIKNEDWPAQPTKAIFTDGTDGFTGYGVGGSDGRNVLQVTGETKREKAFWQVYSAMISNTDYSECSYEDIASYAIAAVSEGFKALERGDVDE